MKNLTIEQALDEVAKKKWGEQYDWESIASESKIDLVSKAMQLYKEQGKRERDAVEFAEFISKGCLYQVNKKWMYDAVSYTTEQLYELFKAQAK